VDTSVLQPKSRRIKKLVPGGELNPQGAKHRRILSTQAGSEPFGKFSALHDSSTAYQTVVLTDCDPFGRVLSIELLQFYYSQRRTQVRSHCLIRLALTIERSVSAGLSYEPDISYRVRRRFMHCFGKDVWIRSKS
jgi:hypothetical protein